MTSVLKNEVPPAISWQLVLFLSSFRQAMPVTEGVVFIFEWRKTIYYRCPRCTTTLEREFVSFCDRCGQCLDWKGYKQVKIVRPGKPDFSVNR